ncbi:hypothetical protein GCM10027445_10850 [Amycolatopsis endophytica]|uniref:Uncharacterized protein n=1 Tax=Amycolatopsis endophytica TaxID=860233 RepID=A0A853AXG0_9PSEU|nr:hypothetical protein [Amycolatopsis endophytica]NYI87319.1 hypothetical protein [Amycolatopsis endophytica]
MTTDAETQQRLHAVLRDQLRMAQHMPGFLPAPTTPLLRDVAAIFLANRPTPGRWPSWGEASGRANGRSPVCSAPTSG